MLQITPSINLQQPCNVNYLDSVHSRMRTLEWAYDRLRMRSITRALDYACARVRVRLSTRALE